MFGNQCYMMSMFCSELRVKLRPASCGTAAQIQPSFNPHFRSEEERCAASQTELQASQSERFMQTVEEKQKANDSQNLLSHYITVILLKMLFLVVQFKNDSLQRLMTLM